VRTISARLDTARCIAKRAGETALGYFLERDRFKVLHEAAQNRVSEASRAVEALIATHVTPMFSVKAENLFTDGLGDFLCAHGHANVLGWCDLQFALRFWI
jgi:hypothetical protein